MFDKNRIFAAQFLIQSCIILFDFFFSQNFINRILIMTEEYVQKKGRDWLWFFVFTAIMVGILFWKPEWVWVTWPFQFTFLTGAMGRM